MKCPICGTEHNSWIYCPCCGHREKMGFKKVIVWVVCIGVAVVIQTILRYFGIELGGILTVILYTVIGIIAVQICKEQDKKTEANRNAGETAKETDELLKKTNGINVTHYCSHCGSKLRDGSTSCSNCGTPVKK